MRKTMLLARATLMLTVVGLIGCSKPPDRDARLAEMAKHSLDAQAQQNERLAEQSREIAETARHLVEEDAKARRELAETHASLRQDLQQERASIDRQRDEMETERRELAEQRGRDPIIAETIGAIGVILACLLPLLLAAYVLFTASRNKDDSEMLNELLVTGIIDDELRLLSGGPSDTAGRLEQHRTVAAIDDRLSEVRDAEAVRNACRRLKLAAPVHGTFDVFETPATGLGVHLPDWDYPIVCDTATGKVQYDNYEGSWGDLKELDHFKQAYAIEKARIEARKKGHTVTEQPLEDGSVKLTIQVGGAT